MTAPTSDERREVAEQLREARPSTYYAEELVDLIKDALLPAYPAETWREPTDVLSALADLIDPTGSLVLTTDGSAMSRNCPECGDPIYHNVNYCPNCGVRLVEDDGE